MGSGAPSLTQAWMKAPFLTCKSLVLIKDPDPPAIQIQRPPSPGLLGRGQVMISLSLLPSPTNQAGPEHLTEWLVGNCGPPGPQDGASGKWRRENIGL